MKKVILITLVMILGVGCAPKGYENQSIDIDVYPVRYQMSLIADKKHSAKMSDKWNQFYAKNSAELLNRPVTIFYSSSAGKKVAKHWLDLLVEGGARKSNLNLEASDDLGEFDVAIEITKYKVVSPTCESVSVERYMHRPIGCAVNSNLWHSMSYPEDALFSTD